ALLPPVRRAARGASPRRADRRGAPPGAAAHGSRPARRDRARARRRRTPSPSGDARLPGAAHRRERRARRARRGPDGGHRAAGARRSTRRDRLSLARRPAREGALPRRGARLRLPAAPARVHVRARAAPAPGHAPCPPADRRRGARQSARPLGAPARRPTARRRAARPSPGGRLMLVSHPLRRSPLSPPRVRAGEPPRRTRRFAGAARRRPPQPWIVTGLDLSTPAPPRRRFAWPRPAALGTVAAGAVCAALLLVALRMDSIRLRYALADAVRHEQTLLDQQR